MGGEQLSSLEQRTQYWIGNIKKNGSGWLMGKFINRKVRDDDATGFQTLGHWGQEGENDLTVPSVFGALSALATEDDRVVKDRNWLFFAPELNTLQYVCWSHPKSEYTTDRSRAKRGHAFVLNLHVPQAELLFNEIAQTPDLMEKIFSQMFMTNGLPAEHLQRIQTQMLKLILFPETTITSYTDASQLTRVIRVLDDKKFPARNFSRPVGELPR